MSKLLSGDELKDHVEHIGYWNNGYAGSIKYRVSIFDVKDSNGLNAIIGSAKHKNSDGTVLYRGQCRLYPHLLPSIRHDSKAFVSNEMKLTNNINEMFVNKETLDFFKWKDTGVSGWEIYIKTIYEATLQHYGGKTNCVDFVDNHWTALWFALNKYDTRNVKYQKEIYRNLEDNKKSSECISFNPDYDSEYMGSFGYIFLYLAETSVPEVAGLYLGQKTYTVDLRKALPEKFLRPVAQHGWVVRKKDEDKSEQSKKQEIMAEKTTNQSLGIKDPYSFDDNVVGILRISTALIEKMLGNGSLLHQENFFPAPAFDKGYHFLKELQKYGKLSPDTLMEYK